MTEKLPLNNNMLADFKKRLSVVLVFTVPVLLLSPAIQKFLNIGDVIKFKGDLLLLFILSTFVYLYGGYPFLSGLKKELKAKSPGMMTLIGVAISVAYFYSSAVVFGLVGKLFFWELVTLIDVMLLGHFIEMKSVMGASRALEELAKLMPSVAHRLNSKGEIEDISLEDLMIGDKILIRPGEKISADGRIIKGWSSINESMLTGESKPVFKEKGNEVIGGSINGEGSITVIVEKTGKDSFLSQVIELVREAQESKSKTQNLANKAAFVLTVMALLTGTITLFLWVFFTNQDFVFAIERMVTVMVIACPHALGLAVPLVIAVSTSIAAKNGFFIRNRNSFEQARNIQAIIFDKTGTLTEGKFGITDIITFNNNISKEEMINLAGSVENNSEHPIAKGIVARAKKIYPVQGFMSIPGKGAEAMVKDINIKIVSPGYLKEKKIKAHDEKIKKIKAEGKTIVYILANGESIGVIALADIIRPESKEAISMMKKMGIKSIMLTGDNKQVAKWVAEEVGIDEYLSEVLPQEKAAKVREIRSRGLVVAMAGDGINDAPALAQADVGIAIGAGTDIAVETADVVLVKNNPRDVVAIVALSRAMYKKMIQNLVWATGYNALAIPVAAGVLYNWGILLNPAIGALLMSLSTVIVAINARFLKITQK